MESAETPTERVLDRLEALYEIGRRAGANRPGLGPEEQQACTLAASWMAESGLEVRWDPAGNVVGRRSGRVPDLSEVWTGSHLDTVPDGGRFDGALGVVAAIEAVSRSRAQLERTVTVVAFRDEEGVRFGGGCFGSRALCGQLDTDELEKSDRDGGTVAEALASLGFAPPPLDGWIDGRIGSFLEAHIEQGPRLERAGAALGIVTSIAGTSGTTVTFTGRAGHAGTTPMETRADALLAAARFALGARDLALEIRESVVTVGRLTVEPGAANVIPAAATVTVDARAPDRAGLAALLDAVESAAHAAAWDERCRASCTRAWLYDPVEMSPEVIEPLRRSVEKLGCPWVELASGAGHDASVLAAAGIPTGMLFVRSSAGGVSHSPAEWTEPSDLGFAIEALAATLQALAT